MLFTFYIFNNLKLVTKFTDHPHQATHRKLSFKCTCKNDKNLYSHRFQLQCEKVAVKSVRGNKNTIFAINNWRHNDSVVNHKSDSSKLACKKFLLKITQEKTFWSKI